MHETTANSDKNLVPISNFNINSFLSKLVNTFCFSQEHNLKVISFRIIIYELSEFIVYFAFAMWNINLVFQDFISVLQQIIGIDLLF